MVVGYYFSAPNSTTQQYDESLQRLDQAGQGSPDGRLVHVAFTGDGQGGLSVFDVWESEEKFEAFGQTLMPILDEIGMEVGKPDVVQVHNMVIA